MKVMADTKQTIQTNIDAVLVENTTGDISATSMNQLMTDVNVSTMNELEAKLLADMDAQTFTITNVATPTNDTDVSTKSYVDAKTGVETTITTSADAETITLDFALYSKFTINLQHNNLILAVSNDDTALDDDFEIRFFQDATGFHNISSYDSKIVRPQTKLPDISLGADEETYWFGKVSTGKVNILSLIFDA